jgi:hypothetical protein
MVRLALHADREPGRLEDAADADAVLGGNGGHQQGHGEEGLHGRISVVRDRRIVASARAAANPHHGHRGSIPARD